MTRFRAFIALKYDTQQLLTISVYVIAFLFLEAPDKKVDISEIYIYIYLPFVFSFVSPKETKDIYIYLKCQPFCKRVYIIYSYIVF